VSHWIFSTSISQDVTFYTYERSSISVVGLHSRIEALKNNGSDIVSQITDKASEVSAAAAATLAAAQTQFQTMMSSAVSDINADIDSSLATASSLAQDLVAARSTIIDFRTNVNAEIEEEENELLAFQVDASLNIANLRLAVQVAITDDVTDRVNLQLEDSEFLATSSTQIAASIAGFISTEESRAVVEAASLSTAVAAFSATATANITSAVTSEMARFHAASSTAVLATALRPTNASGTLDNGNW
jgi:hypothetical protein